VSVVGQHRLLRPASLVRAHCTAIVWRIIITARSCTFLWVLQLTMIQLFSVFALVLSFFIPFIQSIPNDPTDFLPSYWPGLLGRTAQPYFPAQPPSCPVCQQNYNSIMPCAQSAPVFENASMVSAIQSINTMAVSSHNDIADPVEPWRIRQRHTMLL
jgi:hypothetical protein